MYFYHKFNEPGYELDKAEDKIRMYYKVYP
jgi:hypothetical protein